MSPNLPNPYQVLGVEQSASPDEIKRAYRKLARENHPDASGGCKTKESRFKDISAAYEILRDPAKRSQYDTLKSAGPGAIPEGVFDLGDLFAEMFGGAGPSRSSRTSGGPGIRYDFSTGRGAASPFSFNDLGSVFGNVTPRKSPQSKKKRPATTRRLSDGSKARIKGLDLRSDVRIAVDQAILGTAVLVPTKDGRAKIRIPAGSASGTILRLRGKGLRNRDRVGDHYLTVQIDVPKNISDEATVQLVQFMETAKKDSTG